MKFTRNLAMTSLVMIGLTGMLPATVFAAATGTDSVTAAKNLPNASEVTLTGTVEDYDSRHPFTLRDNSGTIQVDLSEAKPIVLHNGQHVTITGDTDKGLFGTNIVATDVQFDTAAEEKVGSNAIEPLPTRNASGASQTANANANEQ